MSTFVYLLYPGAKTILCLTPLLMLVSVSFMVYVGVSLTAKLKRAVSLESILSDEIQELIAALPGGNRQSN